MSERLQVLSTWLTLFSNIGVIAGFVLIAFQLQQNTQALQVQGAALASSANITAESAYMGGTSLNRLRLRTRIHMS